MMRMPDHLSLVEHSRELQPLMPQTRPSRGILPAVGQLQPVAEEDEPWRRLIRRNRLLFDPPSFV